MVTFDHQTLADMLETTHDIDSSEISHMEKNIVDISLKSEISNILLNKEIEKTPPAHT